MNISKQEVIFLCIIFFIVGYIASNFNTLKAEFCADKQEQVVDTQPDNTLTIYEVKKGDTLDTIAAMYAISKSTIMKANKMNTENLVAGKALIIPASDTTQ